MEKIYNNLANNGPRFLAYMIDIVPIIFLVTWVFYMFFGFDVVFEEYLNRAEETQPRADFLKQRNFISEISFGLWLMYCIVMEASEKQGTFGKQLMKIKVVDEEGYRMSFNQSVGRNACKVFSHMALSIGFFWILFDKKKQGWHDKLTHTFVVSDQFQKETPITDY